MPAPDPPRLLPSILDRLYDRDAMGGRAAGYDPDRMAKRVRADLEDLLNTRRTYPDADLPAELVEVRESILAYGLPDLSGYDIGLDGPRDELARTVEAMVRRHEPRLRRVRVVVDREGGRGPAVRFRIQAELNVDPAPQVGFDTVVELTSGKATVDVSKDGR